MLAFQTSSVELTAGRSNQKGCVKMRKVCIQKMSEDVISLHRGCADNCLHALGEVQHDSYKFTGVVFLILVSPRLDQMLGGATQEPDFSYHKKPGLSPTDRQRTPFATWQSELSTVCMIRSYGNGSCLAKVLASCAWRLLHSRSWNENHFLLLHCMRREPFNYSKGICSTSQSFCSAGNLGPIADVDPLKPATTPMDFSRLGSTLPSGALG